MASQSQEKSSSQQTHSQSSGGQSKGQSRGKQSSFSGFFFPNLEAPSFLEEATNKSVENIQNSCNYCQEIAQEASDIFQKSCDQTQKNFAQCQIQAINFARDNAESISSHTQEVMNAQSPAQLAELQISFIRNQLDQFTRQARSFQSMAEEMVENSPAKKIFQMSIDRLNNVA